MADLNTRDVDSLAGATYFVVGRGTEGGPSSYHLSITGITVGTADPHWGNAQYIMADSGYSLGTIQVDLGKRGTWALGATDGTTPKPDETTYVDGIIDQSTKYANEHGLTFSQDTAQLRADLLTHGNGKHGRTTLAFIDNDTRDSIDAWASSEDGQKWIHSNIDYPQIKHATQSALNMLDTYGKNIPGDRRLETVAILAKTENQIPSQMAKFEQALKDGGNYDDLLAKANEIKGVYAYYDGPKAAALAESYKNAYQDHAKAEALDRAHVKVRDANFNPLKSASDQDINEALIAIGQDASTHARDARGSLHQGAHGERVAALQANLAQLGFVDMHGRALHSDGDFGADTKAAVEKFQHAHNMTSDGIVGPETLDALQNAVRLSEVSFADHAHPGHAMYEQA